MTFSKYCSFDSRGDVINPKLGQKEPKVVFHLQMIERWKSIAKGNLRWSIRLLNHYLKIWSFDFSWWRHQSKNESKKSKLVFHVPMMIERWKSRVKGALRQLLSQNFEILTQRGNVINSKFAHKSNNDVRTRIKISKFVEPVLRSQYICLKVSINSYFDPLNHHLYVMYKLGPFLTKFGIMTSQRGSKGRGGTRVL